MLSFPTERLCRRCQEGWRLFDTRCYYFSSDTLAWGSSRAWCQSHGADLLVVSSEEEQVGFRRADPQISPSEPAGSSSSLSNQNFVLETSRAQDQRNTRLWIGLTDTEEEGTWLWADGRSVTSGSQ